MSDDTTMLVSASKGFIVLCHILLCLVFYFLFCHLLCSSSPPLSSPPPRTSTFISFFSSPLRLWQLYFLFYPLSILRRHCPSSLSISIVHHHCQSSSSSSIIIIIIIIIIMSIIILFLLSVLNFVFLSLPPNSTTPLSPQSVQSLSF